MPKALIMITRRSSRLAAANTGLGEESTTKKAAVATATTTTTTATARISKEKIRDSKNSKLDSKIACSSVSTFRQKQTQLAKPKAKSKAKSTVQKKTKVKHEVKKAPQKQSAKTLIEKPKESAPQSVTTATDNLVVKRSKSPDDNKVQHVNKKRKYAKLEFNSSEPDPIVEHLREFYKTRAPEEQPNLDIEILDQVALEGLSGITLGRLFRILEAIFPALKCTNDENCQHHVWSVIVNKYLHYPLGASIQAFYVDPSRVQQHQEQHQEQQDVKQSTGKSIVIDKQIRLPLSTVQRIAKSDSSLYPIQDGPIMGSCANYLTRIDITNELKDRLDELGSQACMYDLNENYGLENVFFVAGQTLRAKAILPNWADPNIGIKLREYCALELIGKSRTLGTVFPNDKTLGRYRIMLLAKGFITQFQETNSSPIEHHLKRFVFKRPTSSVLMTRQSKGDSSDEDEESSEQPLSSMCFNPSKVRADRSILTTVYDCIAESDGLTQIDIRKSLRIPKFHLRNHLKNLISIKMICSRTKGAENPFRIYRTVHRNSRKKKRSDQFENATGIMANWDEIDLRAKKIIGHKRSNFSQAEDSLLILCRITSLLIEPGLKLSWCVHKRVVRDILHKRLVESHDKTSDACLRRIKYLKRLPNNIMSINELTAELQDDQDITNLIQKHKPESDDKLGKLFVKVLKTVRSKIPSLLGLTGHSQASNGSSGLRNYETGSKLSLTYTSIDNKESNSQPIVIKDHKELSDKFELIDCQSVASIQLAPTYEKPKNVVDVKFNTASLVTMAYTLSSFLKEHESQDRRSSQWLLEKFYSSQHDKLINSVQSKLTKRSLLTRKCPADRAQSVFKPKTKTSLKLNQSVHFLLNRYHSTSLMQLTRPINQLYTIDLNESNEMGSFAMLTSLCSLRSFNLDLNLKIPANVVGIDQGNENFRSLCEKVNDNTRDILARFMSRCGGALAPPAAHQTAQAAAPKSTTIGGAGPSASASASLSSAASSCSSRMSASADLTNSDGAVAATSGLDRSGGAESASTSSAPALTALEPVPALALATSAALTCQPGQVKWPDVQGDCASNGGSGGSGGSSSNSNGGNGSNSDKSANVTQPSLTTPPPPAPPPTTTTRMADNQLPTNTTMANNKMDDSRRALFLLRHELKANALDKFGSLSDCLIVQPCNVKFYSEEQVELTKGPLDSFLDQAKPIDLMDLDQPGQQQQPAAAASAASSSSQEQRQQQQKEADKPPHHHQQQQQQPLQANWLVKSFRLPRDKDLITDRDFETHKTAVEFGARLWKSIDGSAHIATLLKLIEALLSWIIVLPGVEQAQLQREFGHLMPEEHLLELLELMEGLKLISSNRLASPNERPRLFGYAQVLGSELRGSMTYEPTAGAFVQYCQLLNYCQCF